MPPPPPPQQPAGNDRVVGIRSWPSRRHRRLLRKRPASGKFTQPRSAGRSQPREARPAASRRSRAPDPCYAGPLPGRGSDALGRRLSNRKTRSSSRRGFPRLGTDCPDPRVILPKGPAMMYCSRRLFTGQFMNGSGSPCGTFRTTFFRRTWSSTPTGPRRPDISICRLAGRLHGNCRRRGQPRETQDERKRQCF